MALALLSDHGEVCQYLTRAPLPFILWCGNPYWTSGSWNNSYFKSSLGQVNFFCNFSYTSSENETYFSFSTVEINSPQLTIDYMGILSDGGGTLVDCGTAFSYLSERCVAPELPKCRSSNDTFSQDYSSLVAIDGFKFNEGDNLTHMDCEAKWLNKYSCVAYASVNEDAQTGCEIRSTPPHISRIYSNVERRIYFKNSEDISGNSN